MKEKSAIEKNAAEKQVELLSSALGNAAEAGGYWLNTGGKQYPRFYPKGHTPFLQFYMPMLPCRYLLGLSASTLDVSDVCPDCPTRP